MAERRMFSRTIVRSGAFLELPASAQLLYFHLGMEADDDGFVSNPKVVARMVRGSSKAFQVLVERGFVISFEGGVCVLRHWLLNNQIRNDRYHPTVYREERGKLYLDDSKTYCLGQPAGNQMEPETRLDQSSPEKTSQDKPSKDKTSPEKRPLSERLLVI